MTQTEFIILALLAAVAIVLQLVLLMRARGDQGAAHFERMERSLQSSAQATRQELAANMAHNHAASVQQLEGMREVIRRLSGGMEATAGSSLVDHFYDEAVAALSDRMRYLALVLDLFERV